MKICSKNTKTSWNIEFNPDTDENKEDRIKSIPL